MILSTLTLLPVLFGMLGVQPADVTVSRVVISNELIMRVPVVRQRIGWPVRWIEKKGPKCIDAGALAAGALAAEDSIDFLLRDGRRMRAKLESECPALDFYGGFYLQPEDGRICSGRDEIRSRIGGACRIDKFRTMVPGPVR